MTRDTDPLQAAKNNNMNVYEGHLGGYIMSSADPAPSGLDITHGDPATWYPELWLWTMSHLGVRSVLDVGCAEGHCIEFYHRRGCNVRGVDGSRLAKERSLLNARHDVHDFTDGPYTPPGRYDLVWCCEFVEHVEERYMPNFLHTFGSADRFIMLTYAVRGQEGWHHVNCQPREYWLQQLEDIGYQYDPTLTEHARTTARRGHFKVKGLVFVAPNTSLEGTVY
jgi:SAM-dependent methyltransferase